MSRAALDTSLLAGAEAKLPDDALAPVRQQMLEAVRERGFPTLRDEDWKYTNLAPAIELSNAWLASLAERGPHQAAPMVAELPELDAHVLLLVDGKVDEVALKRVRDEAGDAILVERLAERPGAVAANGPLDTFNAALLSDGLHLAVRGTPDRPLAVVFADGGDAASQSRVVIEFEPNASAEIVEYHLAGRPETSFANGVVQLDLAAGARASYLRIQRCDENRVHVGKLAARLSRDALLDFASFDLGGGLVRHDVAADIAEPGATVMLKGLYLAGGRQHVDNHTRIDHRVGPATSREEYRGILGGRARAVWNGKAIVYEGADGTDAEQANHNLLIGERAEVDPKPELEIYAEDVKCAHGATVGQLDEAALYYLRSRGLSRDEATLVLTRAFAARVMAELPVESLREHLEALVEEKLDTLLEETES